MRPSEENVRRESGALVDAQRLLPTAAARRADFGLLPGQAPRVRHLVSRTARNEKFAADQFATLRGAKRSEENAITPHTDALSACARVAKIYFLDKIDFINLGRTERANLYLSGSAVRYTNRILFLAYEGVFCEQKVK